MKILLTGASGLLGRAVYREFKDNRSGFDITGTAFSRTGEGLLKIDLMNRAAIVKAIEDGGWDLIIHTAAERRPDAVKQDPEAAGKLNVEAVETIAEAAEKTRAAVLYMSTDYVFDGSNPPYRPEAKPAPLNLYGEMKLEGEKRVLSSCGKPLILRVPILYGNEQNLTESAVLSIAAGISRNSESFHDNEAVRYPTHVEDVARVIACLAELLKKENSSAEEITGRIFHWSGESPFTKYEIALLMSGIMNIDKSLIKPAVPDPNAAPRPKNSHLDTSDLRKLGIASETCFKASLEEALSRLATP